MKLKAIILTFALTLSSAFADSVGNSAKGSGHLSLGVAHSMVGSIQGIASAAEGSLNMASVASEALAIVSSKAVEGSAHLVVKSAEVVGDIVEVTFEASIAGSELASEIGSEVVEFTVEFSKDVLQAAGKGVAFLVKNAATGSEIAVKASAQVLGTTTMVVGYSIALAATPAVVLGVVLTEVGESLYSSNK